MIWDEDRTAGTSTRRGAVLARGVVTRRCTPQLPKLFLLLAAAWTLHAATGMEHVGVNIPELNKIPGLATHVFLDLFKVGPGSTQRRMIFFPRQQATSRAVIDPRRPERLSCRHRSRVSYIRKGEVLARSPGDGRTAQTSNGGAMDTPPAWRYGCGGVCFFGDMHLLHTRVTLVP